MKLLKRKAHTLLQVLLSSACMLTVSSYASAQSAQGANSAAADEIVVTGSRRAVGSTADLPSPVDVIPTAQLQNQGSTDISDTLRTLVPSFNVSAHPISGTSSLIRPPNLRGLGADQTLVLVNGKRRHRAANIPNFSGGINDGTQGADISNIPAIALKSVEVLRDGASAQYGADAIAGVLNFIANDDPTTRRVSVRVGQYYEGDGDTIHLAGTFGIPIGDGGSLNISGEYTDSDGTLRAQQSAGNQAFADAGFPNIPNPAIEWGAPEVRDNISLFANLVVPVSEKVEAYGYASYNNRDNISGFFYRNPFRSGVFAVGGDFLVFDTTGNDTGNCPVIPLPDLADQAAVQTALTAIAGLSNNPDCFSFLEDFPGGTAPRFSGVNDDFGGSFGLRGEFDSGLSYDISYTHGRNEVTYRTFNNFNPTFGPDSPNFLVAGSRIQEEQTLNLQLVYPYEVGLHSPLNVAGGIEWRREDYEQVPGQVEAYGIGPFTDPVGPATTGVSVGTLGFGSFNPATSFQADRTNYAVYLDLEADVTARWTLGGAIRFEDFSDVGSDVNFKIASLFHVTDEFGIRGTVSTGFHAPTPGQQNFAQSTVAFGAGGQLQTNSTLPTAIAAQLPTFAGLATQLTPETSTSFTAGIVWTPGSASLTIDAYQIDVNDRITQTSTAGITDADRDVLLGLGFTNAAQFQGVNFFTNDFDTRTRGLDVVGSIPFEMTQSGHSNFSVGVNVTDTTVTRQGPNLSDLRLLQLEEQLPSWRGNAALTHEQGKLRGLARINVFGPLNEYYLSIARLTELDTQITVDLEAGYRVFDSVEISIGAQNVFDSFPTEAFTATSFGNTYPVASPNGFGGGFYYSKLTIDF